MSEVGRYKEFLRKASSMGLRDDLEVFSGSSCSNCMMVVSSYTSGVQGVRPLRACSPGITVIEGRGLRIGVRDRREEFQFWNLVMSRWCSEGAPWQINPLGYYFFHSQKKVSLRLTCHTLSAEDPNLLAQLSIIQRT